MTNEYQPQFNFGDLVRVAGYWPQVFVVDGRRKEHYEYPDEEWTEMIYELHGAFTLEWLEADVEDLTLVAPAANAEEYLTTVGQPTIDLTELIIGVDWAKGEDRTMYGKQPKEPRKPTARELSAQEAERRKQARKDKAKRVDELLDAKNDFKALYEAFGDSEYLEKQTEIDAELAVEMAKGDGE